ncbi:hypothetical protein ROJ8625_01478 [Roseivivax jejudonensis]|uniref:Sulfatase n=2 Tax=Roseivivax jejudonensis TaxID=1529041 RepID=A0A1X6YV05_9RHOB|nr:hypothetical protein ROJ8625_01478 [Roseivivax jejudonensis]
MALVLGACVLLHLAMVMPSHPAGLVPARFVRPTWELPVILLLLAAFPNRPLRALVIALALVFSVLRIADLATYLALSRPFDPLLDIHLLVSGWELLVSSVAYHEALLAVVLVLGALGAATWMLWAGLSRLPRLGGRTRGAVAGVPLIAVLVSTAVPGWSAFAATPVVSNQVSRMARSVVDLRDFSEELAERQDIAPAFEALGDRDVIVAFIESYGRSFLDDAAYTEVSNPRLDAVETRLSDAGWSIRSTFLAAPTRGGQSWLSHGTFLSGLWVNNQSRYDRLMISDRASLNALFGEAGWATGAAMPAIVQDWPEAAWYDYDTTLDASGLAYAGEPFEWVTMPDQYTWSAMDRLLRGPGPDMIEMALITSHAPWTPLPRIVPWDAVGDGGIFDGTQRDGDTPREVWSDPERIRTQYGLSLDYALEVMGQYIARDGEDALFIVLGDHQPAPLLTGEGASPDVPMHVISRDTGLLERLPDEVFSDGIRPAPDRPALSMDAIYGLMTSVFEDPDVAASRTN